jgi:hypothetical protein
MKYLVLLSFLFVAIHAKSQEDYTINVDGKDMKISLDKKYEVMVNGKKVTLQVKANDTLSYSDSYISFRYPKGFNITKT